MSTTQESIRIEFTPTGSLANAHPYEIETGVISYLTEIGDPAHAHHDESAHYFESFAEDESLVLFGIERNMPAGYDALEWTQAVEDMQKSIDAHLALRGLKKNVDYLFAGTVPTNPPVQDYERE